MVGASAIVQRVRRNGAAMGASVCLYPTLRVMPRARRYGVAQSHLGQMSSGVWKAIQRDLRGVQVDVVRCPDDPTTAMPCYYGGQHWSVTHEFCGCVASPRNFVGELLVSGVMLRS